MAGCAIDQGSNDGAEMRAESVEDESVAQGKFKARYLDGRRGEFGRGATELGLSEIR